MVGDQRSGISLTCFLSLASGPGCSLGSLTQMSRVGNGPPAGGGMGPRTWDATRVVPGRGTAGLGEAATHLGEAIERRSSGGRRSAGAWTGRNSSGPTRGVEVGIGAPERRRLRCGGNAIAVTLFVNS